MRQIQAWDASIGRLALVQADSRFCNGSISQVLGNGDTSVLGALFWWKSAKLNGLWARKQRYDHYLFCVDRCTYRDANRTWQPRNPAWCKLKAVTAVLQARMHDSVLWCAAPHRATKCANTHTAAVATPLPLSRAAQDRLGRICG